MKTAQDRDGWWRATREAALGNRATEENEVLRDFPESPYLGCHMHSLQTCNFNRKQPTVYQ